MTRTKPRTARGTRRGRGQPHQGEPIMAQTTSSNNEEIFNNADQLMADVAAAAATGRAPRIVRDSIRRKAAAMQTMKVDQNGVPITGDGTAIELTGGLLRPNPPSIPAGGNPPAAA